MKHDSMFTLQLINIFFLKSVKKGNRIAQATVDHQ